MSGYNLSSRTQLGCDAWWHIPFDRVKYTTSGLVGSCGFFHWYRIVCVLRKWTWSYTPAFTIDEYTFKRYIWFVKLTVYSVLSGKLSKNIYITVNVKYWPVKYKVLDLPFMMSFDFCLIVSIITQFSHSELMFENNNYWKVEYWILSTTMLPIHICQYCSFTITIRSCTTW